MTYLITQIWICLLVAFLLGMVLGYLFCKLFSCKKKSGSCGHLNTDNSIDIEVDHVDDFDLPPVTPAVMSIDDHVDIDGDIDLDTRVDLDGDAYGIQTLEGIGPKTGDLFRSIGIATIGDYLRKLYLPDQRVAVATDLEIKADPLHEWAGMSDLLRIEGVNHQHAELAFASGVRTVRDLVGADASAVVNNMQSTNEAAPQLISPSVPSVDDVQKWIATASTIKSVVKI